MLSRRKIYRLKRRAIRFSKKAVWVLVVVAVWLLLQKIDKLDTLESTDNSSSSSESISNNIDSNESESVTKKLKDTATDPTMSVTFVDIGQGDATLIESDGEYMLIDTGDRDSDNTLITYMQERGVETIDYLILTHPHADHIGEAAEIVETFDVEEIITPQVPDNLVPTTVVYENLLDAMDEKGLSFHAAENETFDFGDCTVNTFTASGEYSHVNNYSVLVKITHGDNDFLITGDCEVEEENEFLNRDIDISADVMKAAHHGSDTSSSEEWLKEVSPQYTVISCGADNKYGHPDTETYSRLCEYSTQVYRTDEDGTVIFESDGVGISCSCQ
jgi:competence protein ComEC